MVDREKKAPDKKLMGSPFGARPLDPNTWPGDPPKITDQEISETVNTDVVVVGAGHAGLQCALAAVECGASVVVIEQKAEDKMTWPGEQIGTYNSEFLTKQGFGGYDLDEIIEEYCKCGNYYINRTLIAKYVKNSGEALDHMLSLVPADSTLLNPDQCNVHCAAPGTKYPIIRGGYKTWAGTLQFRGSLITTHGVRYRVNQFSRMPELLMYSLKESQRLGADWRFGHSAEVLTTGDGRVTGVIAKNADDKYVKFLAAKGVVLSMGNFTDRGFQLGVWAGGHMDNTPFERIPMMAMPPARGFGGTPFVQLNNDGKRFFNECIPYGNHYGRQPTGIISWVSDSNWLETVKRSGLQHGNADFGMPAYFEQCKEDLARTLEFGAEGYDVRNLGLSERETGKVYGANTLEDLAGFLGYKDESKETFLKSIERYNELCRKKYDEDYGRDVDTLLPIDSPPYYGGYSMNQPCDWKGQSSIAGSMAGLHTDDNLCVVDKDRNPIEGLYSAGTNTGYQRSVFYATPCGGNFIGMATTHGRVLGKYLALK